MYGLNKRIKRLTDELSALCTVSACDIENIEIRKGKLNFPLDITKVSDGFVSYNQGEVWSGEDFDDYALFRFTLDVPKIKEDEELYIGVRTNKSGGHNMVRPQMLFYVENDAIQGLDTYHESVCISEFLNKDKISIYIYAYSGMPIKTPYGANFDLDTSDGVRLYVDMQIRSKKVNEYYYNILTPFRHLGFFEENSTEYEKLLSSMNDSLSKVDFRCPHSKEFYESIEKANDYILKELYAKDYDDFGRATLVGHTHIDLAWLWRYEHTRNKAVRSFATEVKLLEEFSNHRFMSSQAQLYEYVKEDNPKLYEKIKELVRMGKWEAEGAMWIEPDMNLASGESIVRQIMYGKKFFKDEFDSDCEVLWLPDVFGYTAALPQILKKSGVNYFITAKLIANEVNRFPYDTFNWKGIDGSKVFSHCLTYCSYAPSVENGAVLEGWRDYKNKNLNDEIIEPFGFSDGGGGVTREQIEVLSRLKGGLPGIPKVKIGTVKDFFKRLEERVSNSSKLPTWTGEVYFEKHRGTYTSMGRVKKQNRKCEFLYSNIEWLYVLANCFESFEFPKAEFDKGMKNMLLNQFHDVLPGSAIKEVYTDSDALYEEAFKIGEDIKNTSLGKIVNTKEDKITVFNPYSKKVSGYVKLNDKFVYVKDVPAKGFMAVNSFDKPEYEIKVNGNKIENQFYIITLNENGEIESLFDKCAKRECFEEGKVANKLRIYEDMPGIIDGTREDNWNLDSYYKEHEYEMPKPEKLFVLEENDEYVIIRTERTYQSSVIVQDMIVYARSKRIDFVSRLDWKEHSQVLKVDFPVSVNASRATYEIQFGYLERPTVLNTSWDEAKFEVCAHRWADISDSGYGMALMNDCKYGYSADQSTLSLTLLRCGLSPNMDADKEIHEFTYSILPHTGSFKDADVVKEAYILNNPLFVACGAPFGESEFSLFEADGAVLETVKPAEDNSGYILRFYEPYNMSAKVTVKSGIIIEKAYEVDLLERKTGSDREIFVSEDKDALSFDIKPFEIVTVKLLTK